MPPDPRVHVGVAVYISRFDEQHENEVLLVQRAGSGEYASDGYGTWAMPGGWMDFGESFAETGARECAEEIGCTVDIDDEALDVFSVLSENGEFQIVVPVLRGEITDGEPRLMEPDKHSQVKWVPLRSVKSLILFGSTEKFFSRIGVL